MSENLWDQKGLIREAYRIEGITEPECRSIFLDWALTLPSSEDPAQAIKGLLALYSKDQPDHPMTRILTQGMVKMTQPKRRGGWRSRDRN